MSSFAILVLMELYAATLTPLKPDLACDVPELARHCHELLSRGVHGIALFGTTGEGNSFAVSECVTVLQKLIAKGLSAEHLILGNGSRGLGDTIALGQAALKAGCKKLLIAPPCFYKNLSDEGVIEFYRQVIRAVGDFKLILYHIPQYSGVPLSLSIIDQLYREFPDNLFGLKESEGNLEFTKAVLKGFPKLKVYVGKETQIEEAVKLGAAGSICGKANIAPELILSGDVTELADAMAGFPFIAACKAVMEKKHGAAWSRVRPPLTPLTPDQKRSLWTKNPFSGYRIV